jgi:hypothetical protein
MYEVEFSITGGFDCRFLYWLFFFEVWIIG